jgi:hypothetical protein
MDQRGGSARLSIGLGKTSAYEISCCSRGKAKRSIAPSAGVSFVRAHAGNVKP